MNKKYVSYCDPQTACGAALAQMDAAMSKDFAVSGALMPDMHKGYSLPIGAVVEAKGVVVPSWVGYDIGCGMTSVTLDIKLSDIEDTLVDIFKRINANVPTGTRRNASGTFNPDDIDLPLSDIGKKVLLARGSGQMGTLGGGNHFIEVGVNLKEHVTVTIHSGSRGFGHGLASVYMKAAAMEAGVTSGNLEDNYPLSIDSDIGKDYFNDALYAQQWALDNREVMIGLVVKSIREVVGQDRVKLIGDFINRNHNHVEKLPNGNYIHRKGATHADDNMLGVIPGNMHDGCFIVRGKGNNKWLNSSSHGAGRVLSRSQAKSTLSLDEAVEEMSGIVCGMNSSTLDESRKAYKNIFDVMSQQVDSVEVIDYLVPIINVKAGCTIPD